VFFEENTKNEKMQIELQCYVLRKLISADVDILMGVKPSEKNTDFYACSLSSKTIVYKGQLMPEQVQHSVSSSTSGEQETVATPHAARGWAHPPCRHFKNQSC
jgi:glutamate synthase domain-containing protein 1